LCHLGSVDIIFEHPDLQEVMQIFLMNAGTEQLFFGFTNLKFLPSAATKNASAPPLHTNIAGAKDWMDDFALSVNEASSSAIGYLLFTLWYFGYYLL